MILEAHPPGQLLTHWLNLQYGKSTLPRKKVPMNPVRKATADFALRGMGGIAFGAHIVERDEFEQRGVAVPRAAMPDEMIHENVLREADRLRPGDPAKKGKAA